MLKEMIVEKGRKYSTVLIPFTVFLCSVIVVFATDGHVTAPLLCALAGGLSPLGTTAACIGGVLAYLSAGQFAEGGFIICSLVLITAGKWIMKEDNTSRTSAFVTFISMAFSGVVFGLVVTGSLRQAVLNILYAAICGVSAYFVMETADILSFPNSISADKKTLTSLSAAFVLAIAVLCGLEFSVINTGIVLSVFVLLCACRFFGCSGGVVCGVLGSAGIFLGCSALGLQTAFFGAAGLLAGFVSGYSRITMTAIFSGVILLGHLATGVNDTSFFVQADVIIGSILFLLIPERLVTRGGRFCAGAVRENTEYLGKEMEFAARSLSDIRKNVMDIMAVFACKQKSADNIEKVSSKVCGKCRNRLDCWEKNFENTNSAFMKIQSGRMGIFPAGFECVSKNKILEEFERCKRDDAFSKMLMLRLNENRSFMFSQMEASEDIVNSLSSRINVNISKSMTSILCRTLDRYSVEFNSAIVFYTNENRLVAEIYIRENVEIDIEQMCDILSRELSVPLECPHTFACPGETRIRFSQKTKYSLDYAQFQLSAQEGEQSGDTCGYFTDGLGYAYVFVSDGMGHGSRAAVDSQITAKLFKRLVRLGMSCEGAVKMINTIMLAKSEEESFATLDIAKINLETGGVTLCKSGASSTLIKYGDSVMMFSFASNPVGIIHDAHTCTRECSFSEGNVLVMMSDGVPENAYMYIKEQLILGTEPDELAENICRYSRKITSGTPQDDITAVCIKLV
ncbi:MAG: hypothetical protein E7508_02735 [Ruminococcus sp.]|nr:hypothetical protein [Ruminococcus sp.]